MVVIPSGAEESPVILWKLQEMFHSAQHDKEGGFMRLPSSIQTITPIEFMSKLTP
ncbi:hypothetical protein N9933_00540 [bacterium]|nr:hypothetical protein [bacterium]